MFICLIRIIFHVNDFQSGRPSPIYSARKVVTTINANSSDVLTGPLVSDELALLFPLQ